MPIEIERSERNYNVGTKSLDALQLGEQVGAQNAVNRKWDEIGEVIHKGDNQDYMRKTPGKRMKWRNRRFLSRLSEERGENDDTPERDEEILITHDTEEYRDQ